LDKEIEVSGFFDVIPCQLGAGTTDVCQEFCKDVLSLRDMAGAISDKGDCGGIGSKGGGRRCPDSQFETAQ